MKFIFLTFLMLTIGACSATKESFDFSKKAPDEFAVITRAPLEIPSTYNLPKPQPGVQRPQEQSATSQAAQTLFNTDITQKNTQQAPSTGQSLLLKKAGAAQIQLDIRAILDQETIEIAKDNQSTIDKLLGKVGKKYDATANVIDPVKERERLMIETQSATE